MTGGLSLLDLTQIHHRILLEVLSSSPETDTDALVDAASAFLLEVLATYEILRRRFLADAAPAPAESLEEPEHPAP